MPPDCLNDGSLWEVERQSMLPILRCLSCRRSVVVNVLAPTAQFERLAAIQGRMMRGEPDKVDVPTEPESQIVLTPLPACPNYKSRVETMA